MIIKKNILKGILSLSLMASMTVTGGFMTSTGSLITPIECSANDITSHGGWNLQLDGYIHSDGVYAYTDEYVTGNGKKKEQTSLKKGTYVYAIIGYKSHGVTWYMCYSDSNFSQQKYYGWVDAKYITTSSSSNSRITSITPKKGEIDGNGVYGYTTDYVAYGGKKKTQHKVQDTWHITAKNKCSSYGITWYECWDSDDGDYYGWIDEDYLSFYSNNKVSTASITPKKGEVSGKGVYGYTTDYVVNGGKKKTQHKVENTWHITAKTQCVSYGITWYECWDSDDGDYYGWIDSKYLSFYSSSNTNSSTSKKTSVYKKGEVGGNGVYGYTTDYVMNGGSKKTQHKVEDNWHITAEYKYNSHGVTWYECWDSDDGDYYGWIDSKYLYFYN
ncbi:MAG: hypothetical protein IJZ64_08625 [Ruminococcus sp.]|nr:hypothetical protein [Ruminococcus sp.]